MSNIQPSESPDDARHRGINSEGSQKEPFDHESSSNLIAYPIFPFSALNSTEVREVYGMPSSEMAYTSAISRGNYIATFWQAKLRKQFRRISGRNTSLETLLDFPLELFLEIFSYAHPLDLYNMIQTTKSIRNILLNRKASALVWEGAFQCHPDIIRHPSDVSPPKWVSLLFGPAICDFCSRENAMPDFTYCQRFCEECMSKMCHYSNTLRNRVALLSLYPGEEYTLFHLVRCTYKSDPMTYEPGYLGNPRYRTEDVQSKAEEMAVYLKGIHEGILGVEDEYRAFKAISNTKKLQHINHIKSCSNWCLSIYRLLESTYKQNVKSFASWACRLLIKRGHDKRDVNQTYESQRFRNHIRKGIPEYFRSHFQNAQHIRFSKKELYKHLPVFESIARVERKARLKRERHELIYKLENKVRSFYDTLVQTMVAPELWDYVPDERHILKLPPVVSYTQGVYDATNVPDFPSTEMGAVIMNFINNWIRENKRHLIHILTMFHPASAAWGGNADESILGLATAVFSRPGHAYTILIGWEEAGMHASCAERLQDSTKATDIGTGHDFRFSRPAYDTIVLLVCFLGLDPHTALASDMDALKKRFICMRCPLTSGNGNEGSYAMDWRQCAEHSVYESHNTEHNSPHFGLLTDEITESVLFHETGWYSLASAPIWCCKHCPEHFGLPVTKKKVIIHVSEKHRISGPVESIDYFCRRKERPTQFRHVLAQNDDLDQRCMLCQGPSRVRLWTHDALLFHLNLRHKITEPIRDIHWKRPTLISRTTDELEGRG